MRGSGEIAARIAYPRGGEPFRRARVRRRVEREKRREEAAGVVGVRGFPAEADSAFEEPAPVLVAEGTFEERVERGKPDAGGGLLLL